MRRFLVLFLLLGLMASGASAWQFVAETSAGTTDGPVLLFPLTHIDTAGGLFTGNLQVKNTGSGTMTFSTWVYLENESAWHQTNPGNATNSGELFYGVTDSVITLQPDESFTISEVTALVGGVQLVYINRVGSTTWSIAYK